MASVVEHLKALASVDVFNEGKSKQTFVGRPFYFDFSTVKVLVNDKWKFQVGGVPAGAFLLCSYDAQPNVEEMVLVRVLGPTGLPTDSAVVASMVEFYKEERPTEGRATPDSYTRYEFGFSGLECRVLGTFYRDGAGKTQFGADVANFYSAHNYTVYKPAGKVLEYIVNLREDGQIPGSVDQVRLGEVRYSASRNGQPKGESVPVYVSALDFVGKRTALFGMTRTGKSNTLKKVVEAVVELSDKKVTSAGEQLKPVGQIIFDINGEYANPNQQDEGTAIYELFKERTTRYSIEEKDGFEVMKLNFHRDLDAGFGFIQSRLKDEVGDYIKSFLAISLAKPDSEDKGDLVRHERLKAAYRACLYQAGFRCGSDKLKFEGCRELNAVAGGLDPSDGLTPADAVRWFTAVWEAHDSDPYFDNYRKKKGHDWANEDLKAVLVMLTRKKSPGGAANVSGFRKLAAIRKYHTDANETPFESDIVKLLRAGQIVIIDLSQGDPLIQRTYSDRICARIFDDAMQLFIDNKGANFVQMYFEEAHNLFPKKEDKDLSNTYNRLAKEGAKLRIGLVYATQEVSSISGNVLKNTQNWFVSHLNNRDEIREVEKFYDFEDFSEGLLRAPDRGFIRMKTYSNPFIVPVQIDRFLAKRGA